MYGVPGLSIGWEQAIFEPGTMRGVASCLFCFFVVICLRIGMVDNVLGMMLLCFWRFPVP